MPDRIRITRSCSMTLDEASEVIIRASTQLDKISNEEVARFTRAAQRVNRKARIESFTNTARKLREL